MSQQNAVVQLKTTGYIMNGAVFSRSLQYLVTALNISFYKSQHQEWIGLIYTATLHAAVMAKTTLDNTSTFRCVSQSEGQ